jgi:DNA-binding MurR/RpiR family transcriptional regulator
MEDYLYFCGIVCILRYTFKFYGGYIMKEYVIYKKDFFKRLEDCKKLLSDKHKAVLEYVKNNYKDVAYMSIDELSNALKITKEDVSDFIRIIEFDSYENFRNKLKEVIVRELKTTDRFRISMNLIEPKVNNMLTQIVTNEIKNLNNLLNSFDEKCFAEVIEEIMNAPEVIVVGTRASAPIAKYTEYIFTKIGKKTRKIISGGSENFDCLNTLDRNSLVLAFGFARYPKETIRIISFLKKRNFKIVSITDNNLSPLVRLSDLCITVPYESFSFTDYYAVPICVINALVTTISQLNEEESLKHLNEFENIAKEIGYYF